MARSRGARRVVDVETPRASRACQDPWAALAVGVLLQAFNDLRSRDIVDQAQALLWWLSDDSNDWLDLAGLQVDRLGVLCAGVPHKKKYRRKAVSDDR